MLTRKLVETNIDAILESSLALARSVRSIAPTDENTVDIPGWRVLHPNADEMHDIREFQFLQSLPGAERYPFILPRDAYATIVVETGSVAIFHGDEELGDLIPGLAPYFKQRGEECAIRAVNVPASVLIVSYRERDGSAGKAATPTA